MGIFISCRPQTQIQIPELGLQPSNRPWSMCVNNVRGDHISLRRWEKQGAQSQTAPFPPITAPRGTQQRNFPNANTTRQGSSTRQGLPMGSPRHYRHFPPSVAALYQVAASWSTQINAHDPRSSPLLALLDLVVLGHHVPRDAELCIHAPCPFPRSTKQQCASSLVQLDLAHTG